MSLIEKLVGYDRAKYFEENVPMIGSKRDKLVNELLEYRRENNIFEAGDAIVRRWNDRVYWIITDIDNGSEFMISENRNAKFKDFKVCDMPCNFTFATPKEIKAGHRL